MKDKTHEALSLLEEEVDRMADELTSTQITGQMGYPGPVIDASPSELSEEFNDKIKKIRREIEEAESAIEVFLIIAEATAPFGELGSSDSETQKTHFGRKVYESLIPLLDGIDHFANTKYHDEFTEFAEELNNQKYFSDISGLLLVFAMSDEDYVISYMNSYTQQVIPLWQDLVELSENRSNEPNKLLRLYKQWGELAEDALPPIVAIIQYLKNGEVDLDKVRDRNLANSIDIVKSFEHLQAVGKNLDSDIRNSISHGGPTSGTDMNPVERTIKFQYEVNEEVETVRMSFSEFEEHVFRTMGAVIALFLLPLFLLSIHSCIKVDEFAEAKDR